MKTLQIQSVLGGHSEAYYIGSKGSFLSSIELYLTLSTNFDSEGRRKSKVFPLALYLAVLPTL